jgi:hypothetical protein
MINYQCQFCGEVFLFEKYQQCGVHARDCMTKEEKIKIWLEGKHDGKRGKTQTATWIREYVLDFFDNKCCLCGWGEINPYTLKIPLELNHKDGDYSNNKIENLEILCPNCHSLTVSYKGANKKEGRPRSKYYRGT